VAHIVLNRPQARNAITVALAEGLGDALRAAAAQARVIVIRGTGGHFCAGGDFHEVSDAGISGFTDRTRGEST
jgi:enoyl-CoA hydratase/carnithine racemase